MLSLISSAGTTSLAVLGSSLRGRRRPGCSGGRADRITSQDDKIDPATSGQVSTARATPNATVASTAHNGTNTSRRIAYCATHTQLARL